MMKKGGQLKNKNKITINMLT